ncbi:DUF3800 domain-containing protein [Allobaculum stercoricanis]|uniref:DUF3800 domain-containing protein n=1 Tax=Allobaculum stercoricanis TaxID=174709 RepID=UPI00294220E2|nr:DUF3800 domain-containing protein [Allobaculum stercoricanis]
MNQNDDRSKHLMVYLDESGNIHRNSRCRYFAIGGFCCSIENNQKIKSLYKRANKKIKKRYDINLDSELKANEMNEIQKISLFNALQKSDGFCGVGIVFDKRIMYKPIESPNLFYNYGVKVLFDDVIFPLVNESNEEIVFHVICDNRSIKNGDLKDLEKYLSTCFIVKNCSFKVEYRNSAHDYSIQIADLIVNTTYMKQKNRKSVENVLKTWNNNKFSITHFPGRKHEGRTEKLF